MSTGYQAGGRRPLDRILAPEFLAGVEDLPLEEVRDRRNLAEQEEADLSYARRLLQGRLDILGSESRRRAGDDGAVAVTGTRTDAELVLALTDVLTEARRSDHGSGRHTSVAPSRVGEHRRRAEAAVADPQLSDPGALDDEALEEATAQLQELESELSGDRHRVQVVMDSLTEEISRRYRDGDVSVDDALRTAR
ncbi:aerial mycelium formation protein [Kineococcus gynurae]|uniref:Aerial mycelium formation protein n=1 Tax=Kineococcus gynurae TaxID=452979 RepID=A0ABV5LPN6_9ACTN